MTTNTDFQSSYIKDIWLELPNYEFSYEAFEDIRGQSSRWVGREEISEKLKCYLEEGDSGAYLVTGYRGMGKTSYVKRVINVLKSRNIWNQFKEGNKFLDITISFGQKNISELDIQRQIIKGIRDKILPNKIVKLLHSRILNYRSLPIAIAGTFLIIVCSKYLLRKKFGKILSELENVDIQTISGQLIISIAVVFFILSIFIFLVNSLYPLLKLYNGLDDLYDRCRSQITKEAGSSGTNEKFPFSLVDKQVKKFPIANPKEVENEIIDQLNLYHKKTPLYLSSFRFVFNALLSIFVSYLITFIFIPGYFYYWIGIDAEIVNVVMILVVLTGLSIFTVICSIRNKFIFVFDEIDKVDPSLMNDNYHDELNQFERKKELGEIYDFRERKKSVIKILEGLKYLITTAKAKFIFIAGREMFDASLADIADRQSSVSSIFHQVINVDSLLKDQNNSIYKNKKTSSLTFLIENYLEKILILYKKKDENVEDIFLSKYYNLISKSNKTLSKDAAHKTIYNLQNFIIYLTYRSNGSPKKLIRLIEDNIVNTPSFIDKASKNGCNSFEDDRSIVIYADKKRYNSKRNKYFLHINYNNQYRFGFISYLFRPFLASYGPYYHTYNDKILVTTPYLLDHILKFHPFAFSMQNLELIPEILLETRSPELRNFIEDLVTYLSNCHIRETETGLFDYKFIQKTFHELVYLSKIFEDEAAAFNFMLDETYHVKLQLRNKVKELRSIFKEFVNDDAPKYIKSISFLNELLGDAHFFDQEYDDAVIGYSDAIQILENKRGKDIELEDIISLVRFKLKISLTYEKMKKYDTAISILSELQITIFEFLRNFNGENKKFDSIVANSGYFNIFLQPFLAEIFLLEKQVKGGVTIEKVEKCIDAVLKLKEEMINDEMIGMDERTKFSLSSLYSNLSTLFHYKNQSFYKLGKKADAKRADFYNKLICRKKILLGKHEGQFKDFGLSSDSYIYILQSFENLLQVNKIDISEYFDLISILIETEDLVASFMKKELRRNKVYNEKIYDSKLDREYLKAVASNLNKLGDILLNTLIAENIILSTKSIKLESNIDEIWSFHDFAKFEIDEDGEINDYNSVVFQIAVCCFYWSAQIFTRINKNIIGSFMLRKILLCFRIYVHKDSLKEFDPFLEKNVLKLILQTASWNSNASDRFQNSKFKHIFKIYTYWQDISNTKNNYMNLSTSAEVKEAIILYTEIKVKIGDIKPEEFNAYYNIVTPFNNLSSIYVRYHELSLKVQLNKLLRDQELNNSFIKNNFIDNKVFLDYTKLYEGRKGDSEFIRDIMDRFRESFKYKEEKAFVKVQNIIVDSIYCYYQIIKIFHDYGISYFMSYSSLADNHRRLGEWLKYYEFFKLYYAYLYKNTRNKKRIEVFNIENRAKKIINFEILKTMNTTSEFQLALQNYALARQFHRQGTPYKNLLMNMFYLEDDFNDSLYHFSISIERYKLNGRAFMKDIVHCQEIVEESQLYEYPSMVNDRKLTWEEETI